MRERVEISIKRENFGPLWPYVLNDQITDVDYNGRELWVTDLRRGRYPVKEHQVTEEFMDQFTHRIGNLVNKPFNKSNNLLEAETDTLRISIVHESVAVSGRSCCIRKALPKVRMTQEIMLKEGYLSEEMHDFLCNCIKVKMNLVFCGEPGVGKTECAKYFSQFIDGHDRVITIEDTCEWHYSQINPGKDCVELVVDEKEFSYAKAIKTSLRQNPTWLMLSEARSREVKYLLESWSTGVYGFTTIHTDDVRKIPDRIQNMMEVGRDATRLENSIYEFVNVGILIRKRVNDVGKIIRFVDQIGVFTRSHGINETTLLVENGERTLKKIPEELANKFKQKGIMNPFGEDNK